ncbi:50S ribosomal protein L1 [bacterium]|nr:50S ribosomal protein L1 [bacterium]
MARGKIYKANLAKVDRAKRYGLEEALSILDTFSNRKFDEAVEIAVKLGVDAKQSDQQVRGAAVLPHGLGKTVRVVAIVRGDAEKDAREAGADHVGNDDLLEKIEKGWTDFDRVVTTPDTLKDMTRVAKVLGPRGLMPNKKTGTVTTEIGKAIKEQKLGKVNYKVEKEGIVHAPIGRKSFGVKKLRENFNALFDNIIKAKPPTSKGVYIRRLAISTTMGPGLKVDIGTLEGMPKAT